jgi:hypothetical protein
MRTKCDAHDALTLAPIFPMLSTMKPEHRALVWHDQFNPDASGLANAATFGLGAGDTTPITNDNTDYHGKVTNQVNTANVAKQATADLGISRANAEKHARALAKRIKAHPAYTAAFGNLLGIVGPEDTTDISTLKPDITGEDKKGGVVEIDFNLANGEGVNIYSRRDGAADFKFLARDTSPTYVDNRLPALHSLGGGGREYKAVFVVGDDEVSQFSDEITVNCAPLV